MKASKRPWKCQKVAGRPLPNLADQNRRVLKLDRTLLPPRKYFLPDHFQNHLPASEIAPENSKFIKKDLKNTFKVLKTLYKLEFWRAHVSWLKDDGERG